MSGDEYTGPMHLVRNIVFRICLQISSNVVATRQSNYSESSKNIYSDGKPAFHLGIDLRVTATFRSSLANLPRVLWSIQSATNRCPCSLFISLGTHKP